MPMNYSLKIRDIYIDRKWDLTNLSIDIPSDVQQNILQTKIRSKGPIQDIPVWTLLSKGVFTTKSCYSLIEPNLGNHLDFEWIWSLNCPNKIKIFLWQCLNSKLSCRKYMARIGIDIDPLCPICDLKKEELSFISSSGVK